MILVKAPYDEKNLSTDFLADDFNSVNNDRNVWLMFIEDQPTMCTVVDNRLTFKVLGDFNRVLNYLISYFNTQVWEDIDVENLIKINDNYEIVVKSYFRTY